MIIRWNDLFEYTGPICDIGLLTVLTARHRLLRFRAFTFFVVADLATTLGLNLVYAFGSSSTYRFTYLGYDMVIFGLQIWIIVELARAVIRPASQGKWNQEARSRFILYSCIGSTLALVGSFLVQPSHFHGMDSFLVHLEIFGNLLMTEAVIAMLLASSSFGLGWSNHVMAIGQGMMVLALTTVAVDGLYLFIPHSMAISSAAHYIRGILYLATVLYWCIALWREEPARKPISPALRKYIVALHDQVQYDLGKVRH